LILRLKDFVDELAFWNESIHDWDTIYQTTGPRNDSSRFDMAFYPYEGNSTLLCHTLTEGLGSFGTKFRILPEIHPGTGKLIFSTVGT
jgi:hypothetical protein